MDSGNSSSDTQCISRPFTPKKGHENARGAFGHLEKTSKIKKTTRELLSKGYKIGQRKLNYEDSCEEKEPPKKRALRLSRVSKLRCSGYLLFSVLGRQKLLFWSIAKVALTSTNRRQLKIYKELEWFTYNHLHCFLGSLSFLRYKIVVSLNQQQIEIIIVDMAMSEEEGERNLQYFQERGI